MSWVNETDKGDSPGTIMAVSFDLDGKEVDRVVIVALCLFNDFTIAVIYVECAPEVDVREKHSWSLFCSIGNVEHPVIGSKHAHSFYCYQCAERLLLDFMQSQAISDLCLVF